MVLAAFLLTEQEAAQDEQLTINSGGGTNTFILFDVPPWLTSVTLQGGGNDSIFENTNGATTWTFTDS